MKNLYKSFLSVGTFFSLSLQAGAAHAQLCPPQFANLCALRVDRASNIVGSIISILLTLAIILTLIYLVYGGIRWITSGGDKGKVDEARKHITAAVVGLVIAFLALFIVNILSFIFTGATVGGMKIPTLLD